MSSIVKIVFIIATAFFSSCAAVPKQVVDAVQLQKTEIERVKSIYFETLNNQLDAIEKYRYALLESYESQLIASFSTASGLQTANGKAKIEELEATGDHDIDHVNVNHLIKINTFFKDERAAIAKDIQNRREQLYLINKNFENIEQLNATLIDYLQSLKRLTNSQDKMAQLIKAKIQNVIPIPVLVSRFPDSKTVADFSTLLKKQ